MTGKTVLVTDSESINESLTLLIKTVKGELFGDPGYGTNIIRFIYEPNDDILKELIIDDLLQSIPLYEKRIKVTSSDINIISDENAVYISIKYTIITSGLSNTLELTMLKEENNNE
jgi:phage baseplate assembly protein W